MEEIFILKDELFDFQTKHPKYNRFDKVKDSFNKVIGYNASIMKNKNKKQ